MKKSFILILFILVALRVLSAPCETNVQKNVYLGNGSNNYNVAEEFNNNSCDGITFDLIQSGQGMMWLSGGSIPGIYSFGTAMVNAISQEIETSGVFNAQHISDLIIAELGSLYIPDIVHIKYTFMVTTGTIGVGFTNNSKKSTLNLDFYLFLPKRATFLKDFLCVDEVYNRNALFYFPGNEPNISYYNESLTFSNGSTFDIYNNIQMSPGVNELVTITYSAMVNSSLIPGLLDEIPVRRVWTIPLRNIYIPEFLNIPSTIYSNGNPILMDPLTNQGINPPLIKEYFGSGMTLLSSGGNNWVFNPQISGPGDHTVGYRINNQGCKSEWLDTIFSVIGVVNNLTPPSIDYDHTFGSGTNANMFVFNPGYYDYEDSWEEGLFYYGKEFHFVCSDQSYEMKIKNPSTYLNYYWDVYFHDQIIQQDSGVVVNILTPAASSVYSNQMYGLYNFPITDTTLQYEGIENGVVSTNFLGDLIKIRVRSKNVLNSYSLFSTSYLGVAKKPTFDSNVVCAESNNVAVSVVDLNNQSTYIDSLNLESFRRMRLDFDNNGLWEQTLFNGVLPVGTNKVSKYAAQLIDSIKIYGVNNIGEWAPMYSPKHSTVCYSEIDTIKVVRNPSFNVNFNVAGTLNLGDAVNGVVSGSYFDVNTDSVAWLWNDGSEVYNDFNHWHFLNDLGYYSVNIVLTDNYGCSSSFSSLNNWFIPGILSVSEIELSNNVVFPNPISDHFFIKNEFVELVELYDLIGNKIDLSRDGNKFILPNNVESGSYILVVDGVSVKLIVLN